MEERQNIIQALADILTWILAVASLVAAWFQTSRLLAHFGDPSAPWWPYLAATAVEGALVVSGLVLMTEFHTHAAAMGLIIFLMAGGLSVIAQIAEAAISAGWELPDWAAVAVRVAAPASVTVTGMLLWAMKVLRVHFSRPEPPEDNIRPSWAPPTFSGRVSGQISGQEEPARPLPRPGVTGSSDVLTEMDPTFSSDGGAQTGASGPATSGRRRGRR